MIELRHLRGLVADPSKWLDPLNAACLEFGIDTDERCAMFLAQAAHESAQFTRPRENLNYRAERIVQVWPSRFRTPASAKPFEHRSEALGNKAYAGRLGNGNEASGDGFRYRGGGIFQLTGKSNYRDAGIALGTDLVAHPEWIVEPEISARAACWFWRSKNLNRFADIGDLRGCTKAINGGFNGMADRRRLYDLARRNFGLEAQE